MMPTIFICLFSLFTAAMTAAQAVPAPPPPASKKAPPKPALTLTGCVGQDVTPGAYTFSDVKTGAKYRLSGIDVQKAAKKRGEIVVGSGARRLTIHGGLVPSATVAGQAGAIDPAQAAVANMTQGANADRAQLPEFRVVGVQGSSGSCP